VRQQKPEECSGWSKSDDSIAHVNDMCEKKGADAWTTEHARGRWTKYFSKYRTTKGKFTDNTAKDLKKGITTINQKLDNDCPNYMRMDLLFGHRQNTTPHCLIEPGVPNDDDVGVTDDDDNKDFLTAATKKGPL
jgi:hypothetical protein